MNGVARSNGFTLLELLIALSIFSLVSVMAFVGFRSVQDTTAQVEQVTEELSALQLAFLVLGRDMQQAISRSVRDDFGDVQPALTGSSSGFGNMLEFTRTGWMNPIGQQRSVMQRVAYGLKEDNLVRISWPMLDRVQGAAPRESVLLKNVESFALRFLNVEQQWVSEWPPLVLPEDQPPALPQAVEVAMEVEGWGKLVRLFPLVGSKVTLPEHAQRNGNQNDNDEQNEDEED